MIYSNLKSTDRILLKNSKDDEIRERNYRAERHDSEKVLKSLEIDKK